MTYRVCTQTAQTATAAGYVSVATTTRPIRLCVCVNVQDLSNSFTSVVSKTGFQTTSPNVRMNTASSTLIIKPAVNFARMFYPTSLDIKAGSTPSWTSAPLNLHTQSLSTAKSTVVGKNTISTLSPCRRTNKYWLEETTPPKSSWRTSASVVHIAHWSTSTASCSWETKSQSSELYSKSVPPSSSHPSQGYSFSSTPKSSNSTATRLSRHVAANLTTTVWSTKPTTDPWHSTPTVKIPQKGSSTTNVPPSTSLSRTSLMTDKGSKTKAPGKKWEDWGLKPGGSQCPGLHRCSWTQNSTMRQVAGPSFREWTCRKTQMKIKGTTLADWPWSGKLSPETQPSDTDHKINKETSES